MAKYYAKAVRDFSRTITMGALVVQGLPESSRTVIDGPRSHVFHTKQGEVFVYHRKTDLLAGLAANNAENPGCVVQVDAQGQVI